MKSIRIYLLIALSIILAYSCIEEKYMERFYPKITNSELNLDQNNNYIFYAEFLCTGADEIINHGFVWDLFDKPVLETSDMLSLGEANKSGPFQAVSNSSFKQNSNYWFRAYAQTSKYTVYSESTKFVPEHSPASQISNIIPQSGFCGDTIIITGKYFSRNSNEISVFFDEARSTSLRSNSDTIYAVVPDQITNNEPSLTIEVFETAYSYDKKFTISPPTINQVYPLECSLNDTVYIKGENFRNKLINTQVIVGEETAEIVFWSDTLIKFFPPIISKPEIISIVTPGNQVSSSGYLTLKLPEATTFFPESGHSENEIMIFGKYLSTDTSKVDVFFNSTPARITSLTQDAYTVIVPSSIDTTKLSISITTDMLEIRYLNEFTINPPNIYSLSKLEGFGGESVRIEGAGFNPIASKNLVRYNDISLDIILSNTEYIDIKLPCEQTVNEGIITVKTLGQEVLAYSNFRLLKRWQKRASFPGSLARNWPVSFSCGGKLYFGTGEYQNDSMSDLWEYDPVSDAWTKVNDFPGIPRSNMIAFSNDDYAFIGLGKDGNQELHDFWKFYPSDSSWEKLEDIPFESIYSSLCSPLSTSESNQNYLMFFRNEERLFRYNSHFRTWDTISYDLMIKPYIPMSLNLIEEHLYCLVFTDSYKQSTEFLRFSSSAKEWEILDNLPEDTRRYSLVSFVSDNKLYAGMGYQSPYVYSSQKYYNSYFFEYNPSENSWNRISDYPGKARTITYSFKIGDRVFVGLGTNDSENDFYELIPGSTEK